MKQNCSTMDDFIYLGVKVKPGPIERYKLSNFTLENTVENLRSEAEKKINQPSGTLEFIHHGKILKEGYTLLECGIKNGEMIHVAKKKVEQPPKTPPSYTDSELQTLTAALRTLGCTPNAAGWTKAMQLLNNEAVMSEIFKRAPSLMDDCVALSVLHEVELLAALGANLQTLRRAANTWPELPAALKYLTHIVHSGPTPQLATTTEAPTSGFAYSLEALSEDEDADEEETEEGGERNPITHLQLAAALRAATAAVANHRYTGNETLRSLLRAARGLPPDGDDEPETPDEPDLPDPPPAEPTGSGAARPVITSEMFSNAITDAFNRARDASLVGPASLQRTAGSSSQPPATNNEDYSVQLQRMHEMGLLDDALNVRALIICSGDVNEAINLVFSGAIGD